MSQNIKKAYLQLYGQSRIERTTKNRQKLHIIGSNDYKIQQNQQVLILHGIHDRNSSRKSFRNKLNKYRDSFQTKNNQKILISQINNSQNKAFHRYSLSSDKDRINQTQIDLDSNHNNFELCSRVNIHNENSKREQKFMGPLSKKVSPKKYRTIDTRRSAPNREGNSNKSFQTVINQCLRKQKKKFKSNQLSIDHEIFPGKSYNRDQQKKQKFNNCYENSGQLIIRPLLRSQINSGNRYSQQKTNMISISYQNQMNKKLRSTSLVVKSFQPRCLTSEEKRKSSKNFMGIQFGNIAKKKAKIRQKNRKNSGIQAWQVEHEHEHAHAHLAGQNQNELK